MSAIRTGSQRRPKRLNKARHLCDKSDWHRYRKLGRKKIEEASGLGPSMTQAKHLEENIFFNTFFETIFKYDTGYFFQN